MLKNKFNTEILTNEYWIPLVGYEGLYEISNLGRIKSLSKEYGGGFHREFILSESYTSDGYSQIRLTNKSGRKCFKIHRLVAKCFIPNIYNKLEINHKNGVKKDNSVLNLEWCTRSENQLHAFKNNLNSRLKGCDSKLAKFSKNEIMSIRHLYYINKFNFTKISKIYDVSNVCISNIIKENTYKNI
jgi:hypothetical protein